MAGLPVIVITGASSGIGEALALLLAGSKQYRLALIARREEQLKAVSARCGGSDICVPVVADVTKKDQVKAAVATILDKFGTIDVWVNNAGRGIFKSFTDITEEEVQDMLSVNVTSALFCIQEVLPLFKAKGTGQFINVSSLLGRNPETAPMRSAYSASKHFLNSVTQTLRAEHRTTFPNIKFTTYSPGVVATDFGINASGPDSRNMPNAQDVNEVAQVLFEQCILQRKEEVYSRESYKEFIGSYLASLVV